VIQKMKLVFAAIAEMAGVGVAACQGGSQSADNSGMSGNTGNSGNTGQPKPSGPEASTQAYRFGRDFAMANFPSFASQSGGLPSVAPYWCGEQYPQFGMGQYRPYWMDGCENQDEYPPAALPNKSSGSSSGPKPTTSPSPASPPPPTTTPSGNTTTPPAVSENSGNSGPPPATTIVPPPPPTYVRPPLPTDAQICTDLLAKADINSMEQLPTRDHWAYSETEQDLGDGWVVTPDTPPGQNIPVTTPQNVDAAINAAIHDQCPQYADGIPSS
jgi:hypothetical protein